MTPVAAAEAAIAADHAYADPALWICRLPDDDVMDRARGLEREGPRGRPLWGLIFAVKDNLDVAGLPTTAACPASAYTAEDSAPCVQALLDAGAILLGKTNLDQFATGLVGVRSPYGVPRNAFSASHVPGGSSSGSAVAVAAGIVDFALGTDTAGSGRVPAAFGNIVGLKPTLGSISNSGMVPACRSIDTVSVFAATVDAAIAVARIAAGFDPRDPYSRRAPFPHLRRAPLPTAPRRAYADLDTPPDGAERVDISPFLAIARLLYDGPWVAERTAALRDIVTDRPEILHPTTRTILEAGFDRSAVDGFDAFHALAGARRVAEELFAQYDALILPTTLPCPTLAALAADPIGPNSALGTYTNFVNLCDLAAIAVPAGFVDGLPHGVTVLGPAWSEGRLASIADHLHRAAVTTVGATGRPLPPPEDADPVASDETALFCLGAHMSGLPLNGHLRELGGRFIALARTAPVYRLAALGSRPGLVRGGAGALEGEVWALPTVAIGALLNTVPQPLGFGTVELETGPCLGFLAEAAGVVDAPDITAFGGWRAYLASCS